MAPAFHAATPASRRNPATRQPPGFGHAGSPPSRTRRCRPCSSPTPCRRPPASDVSSSSSAHPLRATRETSAGRAVPRPPSPIPKRQIRSSGTSSVTAPTPTTARAPWRPRRRSTPRTDASFSSAAIAARPWARPTHLRPCDTARHLVVTRVLYFSEAGRLPPPRTGVCNPGLLRLADAPQHPAVKSASLCRVRSR